ncbi:HD-GYP domain-containing protein [Propionispora sp. 2/2-37]|uniref:HD-GYP domain-containing protein n=1 Tax=Propionispora sp. 2/2-37 TaxID=1677858 RepID=UPI0006BB75FF|nr:HD-GYP domain-containing protein [Propionispora sp. 2/2-37]
MKGRRFWPSRYGVGTKLQHSLFSKKGQLLLAKGTILTNSHLQTLKHMEVYCDRENSDRQQGYREIPAAFVTTYRETVERVKDFFFSTQYIQDIQIKDVKNLVNSAIKPLMETYGVIDFLHDLRCRDEYTLQHSINVAVLSGIFARWLNYPEADSHELMMAGLLHDIGKITIPLRILNKPGNLTERERKIIQQHPLAGYELLRYSHFPESILWAVLHHHERMDGSGYPGKLKKEEIPVSARIIAVVDMYDAMTSKRVYHEAKTPYEVARVLYLEMFEKLDPSLCWIFLENIRGWIVGNSVLLSDGRKATIVSVGKDCQLRLVVRTQDGQFIDLEKESGLIIISRE